jgi:hypothetical protein
MNEPIDKSNEALQQLDERLNELNNKFGWALLIGPILVAAFPGHREALTYWLAALVVAVIGVVIPFKEVGAFTGMTDESWFPIARSCKLVLLFVFGVLIIWGILRLNLNIVVPSPLQI